VGDDSTEKQDESGESGDSSVPMNINISITLPSPGDSDGESSELSVETEQQVEETN
jgi:hypothetical protein